LRSLDICLTPALLHLFPLEQKVVVVIDVLRATSTICVAIDNGAKKVMPIPSVDECRKYESDEHIIAAEKNGVKIEGFKYGNSPYDFMGEKIAGKTIFLTTTNGTKCIEASKNAHKVIAGSFLNLDATVEWLRQYDNDILLFCAGWKGHYNLEDTMLAGAIALALEDETNQMSDAVLHAKILYRLARPDLVRSIKHSSHYNRLASFGLKKDIEYCMTPNQNPVIPILDVNGLVNLEG